MSLRDDRQLEFADVWMNSENRRGILNLAPRFGKCRVGINIIQALHPSSILIAFPDNKIKQSWEDEFKNIEYKGYVTYTNYRSIGKYVDIKFDLVILD